MSKNIIVTGGCGYIGSHVARAFKQHGDTVTVIDRVQRDHTLKEVDGYFIGDFVSEGALSVLISAAPDVIVHCAGSSLVGESTENPGMYWDNNVVKLIQFLDVIKTLPKKPLILFSSSSSVYGETKIIPTPEDHKIDPKSPYGNTKATCERILYDYYLAHAIPSVCFRFFNAGGAEPFNHDLGQPPGAPHIIARALEASISGEPFNLYGTDYTTPDGTCIRDYIHVWDLARAHVLAAEKDWVGTERINLGTSSGISNRQIVDYINKNFGLSAIINKPKRLGDPSEAVAQVGKARDWLGWEPQYSDINTIIDSAQIWYTNH